MKTLALDIGNVCGWAIINDKELLESGFLDLRKDKSKTHLGESLILYEQLLNQLISKNKDIENIFYEHLELIKNQYWNHQWNAYRGVMMTVAFIKKLKVNPVHPSRIKRHLTGNGGAKKEEMLLVLNSLPIIKPLKHAIVDDNECDAIAIAMLAHDV